MQVKQKVIALDYWLLLIIFYDSFVRASRSMTFIVIVSACIYKKKKKNDETICPVWWVSLRVRSTYCLNNNIQVLLCFRVYMYHHSQVTHPDLPMKCLYFCDVLVLRIYNILEHITQDVFHGFRCRVVDRKRRKISIYVYFNIFSCAYAYISTEVKRSRI